MRWAPTVQVPNPPFRPKSGTILPSIVDDTSGNETWSADGSGDNDQGFYGDATYRRPAPFLFTSSASSATLAQRIADSMFFDASSQEALDALGQQFSASQLQNNGQTSSAPIFIYAANINGPIGSLARISEVIPLYPVPVTLGTSAKQQLGSMQQDEAFQSHPLMLLRHDCSIITANSTRLMDAQNFAQMLRAGSMTCVQMPGVPMDSVASIQEMLFRGYGKGPPGAGAFLVMDISSLPSRSNACAIHNAACSWHRRRHRRLPLCRGLQVDEHLDGPGPHAAVQWHAGAAQRRAPQPGVPHQRGAEPAGERVRRRNAARGCAGPARHHALRARHADAGGSHQG